MKIIKKPIIPRVTCDNCGCEFQPKYQDMKVDDETLYKNKVECPFCKKANYVKFKENK